MAISILGEAAVRVRPETTGFKGEAESGILSPLGGIAKAATGLFAAAFAGGAIVNGFKSFYDAAAESAKIGALTNQVIKSTGGAANLSADQVGNLATAISNKTGVDDEAIQSGENLLLTFTNIKNAAGAGNDIFTQTTQIMTDMSAALGTDASGSAIQLGKALNDPVAGVSALTKVGVSFTDQQKEQIKTLVDSGNTLGAQKVILGELNKEFGGAAAAASTPLDKLKVNLGNLQEAIGGALIPVAGQFANFAVNTLLPGLTRLGGYIGDTLGPIFTTIKDAVLGFIGVFTGGGSDALDHFSGPTMNKIIDIAGTARAVFDNVKNTVLGFIGAFTGQGSAALDNFSGPTMNRIIDAAGFARTIVDDLGNVLKWVAGVVVNVVIPGFLDVGKVLLSVAGFFLDHRGAAIALGVVIGVVAALVVAAWVMQAAAAVTSSAKSVISWLAVAVGAQEGAASSERSTAQVVLGWIAAAASAVFNAAIVVGGWVLMGAQSLLQAARMAAAWVIALGPVAWVIAAIVAVAALVIANWDKIKKWTVDAWNAIVGALKAAWDWIVSAVSTAFNWVIDFVTSLPGKIVSGLAALGSMLWNALTTAFSVALQAIVAGLEWWITQIVLFPVRVIRLWITLGVLLWQALSAAFKYAVTAVSDFISAAVSFFTELPGKIGDALASLGQTLWDLVTAAWQMFSDAMTTAWNAIYTYVTEFPANFVRGLQNIGQTLWDLITAAWQMFSDAMRTAWDAIYTYVTDFPGNFVRGLANIGQTLWDLATAAWAKFSDAVNTGIDAAVGFITGLPGRIWNGLKNMGGMLVQLGTDLMHGLVDGISSAAQFVGNVAKNVVNAIIGFINDKMIDGINGLLDFTVAGIHINVPDIPHIPKLHEGGVFSSGSPTGEGLAVLRDRELVVTPEQRASADGLLRALVGGNLPAAGTVGSAAPTVTAPIYVTQQPGESGVALAARVSDRVVFNLNNGVTATVGGGATP